MKQIFLLFMSAISLWGCNNQPAAHAHNTSTNDSAVVAVDAAPGNALTMAGKWSADERTNNNVAALQNSASALNKQPHTTAADYHQIGTELQSGLNRLVRECTMKGTEHDALHLWLEPLLGEIKELKAVTNTTEGERLFHSIRTRLADYNLFFE